jgi:acetyltransferase-like isoleucine patch superfamily enzyme/acyl carrier protein
LARLKKHKIMTSTETPTDSSKPSRLEDQHYIRQKLYGGQKSTLQRYAELVIGRMDIWELLKYELLTCLLGPLPGAIGLLLRKVFYPWLFRRIGRGVIFGRSVVIRNPDRIVLGDRVVIDDYVVLDGRGGDGDDGLRIGDQVIVNRGALIQAKVGTIRIGSHCDIGAETMIISQGANVIEDMVSIGGGSKIGGGLIQIQNDSRTDGNGDPNDFAARGQVRVSKGAVRIGAKTALGENVTVLDGAVIGSECIVGASAVIRGQIPDRSVVALQERLVVLPRAAFSEQTSSTVESPPQVKLESQPALAGSPNGTASAADPRVVAAIYRAIDWINGELPPDRQLTKELETRLLGSQSVVDSMQLVNLIVAIEREVEDTFGVAVSLADERALSMKASPFRSIQSLAVYVGTLLTEPGDD